MMLSPLPYPLPPKNFTTPHLLEAAYDALHSPQVSYLCPHCIIRPGQPGDSLQRSHGIAS